MTTPLCHTLERSIALVRLRNAGESVRLAELSLRDLPDRTPLVDEVLQKLEDLRFEILKDFSDLCMEKWDGKPRP